MCLRYHSTTHLSMLKQKRMNRILDAKYSKADIKTIAESSTHLDPQERNELLISVHEDLLGLKYNVVPQRNPSSLNKRYWIFGMEYG